MLRDKIGKKNSITQKDPKFKKKIAIKRMRIKIEIKNKLEDDYEFFYWMMKLKRKINLKKWQKNQKNKDQIKNNNISQIGIEVLN